MMSTSYNQTSIFIILFSCMITIGFGQENQAIIHTEIGMTSYNEINLMATVPISRNQDLEVKLGANFNSRYFSDQCGFLARKQSPLVQEHQSMLGVILELNYLWALNKWLRIGPQTLVRFGSAKNVKIQLGCYGGSGQDPQEYDIDELAEWGMGMKVIIGGRDKWVNFFFSGGLRERQAYITRREPWNRGREYEERSRLPMFNLGIKINFFRVYL